MRLGHPSRNTVLPSGSTRQAPELPLRQPDPPATAPADGQSHPLLYGRRGPEGTRIQGRQLRAAAKASMLLREFHSPLDQVPVEILGDQDAVAEGRVGAVETVEYHLPAPIHDSGVDKLVVRDPGVCLRDRRHIQLGRGNWHLLFRTVVIEPGQFRLKRRIEELVPAVAEEDEGLGMRDPRWLMVCSVGGTSIGSC